ncbi:hypothetical protein ATCC90586_007191 [Pythium insidiosum]|nr:hypothetical protein ATCC90586_007191 [Pythium insidiosum]
MATARSQAAGLACLGAVYVGLVAAVVQRMRRLGRRRGSEPGRRWISLVPLWHGPLLALVLLLALMRLLQVTRLSLSPPFLHEDGVNGLLSDAPHAAMAMIAGHTIFVDAHVALFRVWPVRMASTVVPARLLYLVFIVLVVVIVVLAQWIRCTSVSSSEKTEAMASWNRFQLLYLAMVWTLLGATLLQFQSRAVDVLWIARQQANMSSTTIHAMALGQTALALVLLCRGLLSGMVAMMLDAKLAPMYLVPGEGSLGLAAHEESQAEKPWQWTTISTAQRTSHFFVSMMRLKVKTASH